jgi:nucleoside-diphosphate-sugar epimerase
VTAPRALILGGGGMLGAATARRLARGGWQVTILGRDPANVPADLTAAGVEFVTGDYHDPEARSRLRTGDLDLLVDVLCRTAADAEALLPLAAGAASTVMVSSKAVYIDAAGHSINSETAPRFDGPLAETGPTVTADAADPFSREGYATNKIAAEQVLLDSGLPVSVLRVAKAHGRGARNPREWVFLRRVLERRPVVVLANRGAGVDQPVAAANFAALVETVAARPGARILNCGDPDAPSGREIARTVAAHLDHRWEEVLLDGDPQPPLGAHPWNAAFPIVLDMSAARALGYEPAGTYAETVTDELDWLADTARARGVEGVLDPTEARFFTRFFDYELEDRHLAERR